MLNYLKRRFSSTELESENREVNYGNSGANAQISQSRLGSSVGQQKSSNFSEYSLQETKNRVESELQSSQTGERTGQIRGKMAYPSAPNSPSKSSAFGFVGAITEQLSKTKHLFSTETLNSVLGDVGITQQIGEKYKTLLVIDHSSTEWAKYLYKRRIGIEWDVRVEQAQLKDISVSAFANQGCVITLQDNRGSRPVLRSFKPDLVFIRQGVGTTSQNYENVLTGLMFGNVPCVNSLEAIYNMKNKAWLFGQLQRLQNVNGTEGLPLVKRSYQTKCQPMVPDFKLPVFVRIGGDASRECEIKVETNGLFQSLMNLANTTQRYAITEACVQTEFEIHIQKIGKFVKVFTRKPIVSSQTTPPGSMMLEKIPVTPIFSDWINKISQMFGGLDMCAIKAIKTVTGEYNIHEVYGSEFALMGDGQDEDRVRIAELVLQRLEMLVQQPGSKLTQPLMCSTTDPASVSNKSILNQTNSVTSNLISPIKAQTYAQPQTSPYSKMHSEDNVRFQTQVETNKLEPTPKDFSISPNSFGLTTSSNFEKPDELPFSNSFDPFSSSASFPVSQQVAQKTIPQTKPLVTSGNKSSIDQSSVFENFQKSNSSFSETPLVTDIANDFSTMSLARSSFKSFDQTKPDPWTPQPTTHHPIPRPVVPPRQTSLTNITGNEDGDDTMKNLRKTFAGIFGDI